MKVGMEREEVARARVIAGFPLARAILVPHCSISGKDRFDMGLWQVKEIHRCHGSSVRK